MKSIDKFKRNTPVKPNENLNVPSKSDRSVHIDRVQVINLFQNVLNSTDTIISYLTERERTKRVQEISRARIEEAYNRYETVKQQEQTKRLEILCRYKKELEKIHTEREKIAEFRSIVQGIIETIDELKNEYKDSKDMKLLEMIHQEQMKLMDVAIALTILRKEEE